MLRYARERMAAEQDYHFDQGDYPRVIANLKVAVAAVPGDEEAWSNLIWMLGNVDAEGEAWATCRDFARRNPGYAEGPFYEAQFLFAKRMWAKIPALLEPMVAADPPPRDPVSYRMLAQAYKRLEWWEDSRRVLLSLLARWPDDEKAKADLRFCDEKLAGG